MTAAVAVRMERVVLRVERAVIVLLLLAAVAAVALLVTTRTVHESTEVAPPEFTRAAAVHGTFA